MATLESGRVDRRVEMDGRVVTVQLAGGAVRVCGVHRSRENGRDGKIDQPRDDD